MPFAQLGGDDLRSYARRKLEQAKNVRDGRPVLAQTLGQRFLGVSVIANQPVVGLRELDGVEVLALDVLDQRELEGGLDAHVLHDDERVPDAGALKCAPAPLAGDELELVAPGYAPDHQRLDEAVLADALRQLVELVRVEVLPGLPFPGDDLLDRAREDALVAVVRGRRRRQQRVEAAPEGSSLHLRRAHFAIRCGRTADSPARSSRASER